MSLRNTAASSRRAKRMNSKRPLTVQEMKEHLGRHHVQASMRKRLMPKKKDDAERARYLAFEELIIEACTEAHNFSLAVDPNVMSRQSDSKFLSALSGHRKHVKSVASFIQQYAGYLSPAFRQLHRVEGIRIVYEYRQPLGPAWFALLSAYEAGLDSRYLPARQGPFAHRFRDGPLDFGEAVDRRRGPHIDAARTGLLFQLALYFRRYTSGIERDLLGYIQTGEPMPRDGYPCWALCAEALAAIFGDPVPTPDDLRRRLGKLLTNYTHLTFVGWPRQRNPKPKNKRI